jgi:hypothetical protein
MQLCGQPPNEEAECAGKKRQNRESVQSQPRSKVRKLLKGRAERVDAVCSGLHPSVVIGQLAEKYEVSEGVCGVIVWGDLELFLGVRN